MNRARILLLLALPLLLTGTEPKNRSAHLRIGTVTETRGDVRIGRDKSKSRTEKGTAVHNNDRITTAPGARIEIRLINDSTIAIGPDTRLRISTEMTPDGQLARVALIYGTVRARVKKQSMADDSFSVRTVSAAIGIRGTVLEVASGNAPGTLLRVEKGKVEMKSAVSGVLLTAGRAAETRGGPISLLPGSVKAAAWLIARNAGLADEAERLVRDLAALIVRITPDLTLPRAGAALKQFTDRYRAVSDLFRIIPPADRFRRRLELAALKVIRPVLYAAKRRLTYPRLLREKLARLDRKLPTPYRRKLSPLVRSLDNLLAQNRDVYRLVLQAERFYRIRMMQYIVK